MEQVAPPPTLPPDPLAQMNKYRALVATVGGTESKESEKLTAVQELLENLEVISWLINGLKC